MSFRLTAEQQNIVEHEGSAFVSACPGAGKTRCITERAKKVLSDSSNGKGIVLLSFTNAAIFELKERLQSESLLNVPALPHFVGTFDRFIWKYLVEPYGIDVSDERLSLIPDKDELTVRPFPNGQEIKLSCFDRDTGELIRRKAPSLRYTEAHGAYETAARNARNQLLEHGYVDFHDIREIAAANLSDPVFKERLAQIFRARFREIIVDEAQDCNTDDLIIIEWLRSIVNIPTKIVCDPHQSIYGFRGGVSEELFEYENSFTPEQRLSLSGNFRSSDNICKVVHSLRATEYCTGSPDAALGSHRNIGIHTHVLSYRGAVSNIIGSAFVELSHEYDLKLNQCRLVSKTRTSALNAVGAFTGNIGQSLSQRLASAVMKFHFDDAAKGKLEAILETHRILLCAGGYLEGKTYHQYISDEGLEAVSWRGHVLKILRSLKFDSSRGDSREEWLGRVHQEFEPFIQNCNKTVAQLFRNETKVDNVLESTPLSKLISATIHEVKGQEFEGMCVVLTSATAKGILDYLSSNSRGHMAEEARAFYVAASRAEKLLVFACPRNQASRLVSHISQYGAHVSSSEI
jgi:DNA helicase-2/ATP-dependent DNA helicase PcrA